MPVSHLNVSQISLSYGNRDILSDVSFSMKSGDRIALTGSNGSGKSSLMKIIAHEIQADSGTISVSKDARVGYLPQSGVPASKHSIKEETEKVFSHIFAMIDQKNQLEEQMAKGCHEADVLERYGYLQEKIESSGFFHRDSLIESTLKGLGFNPHDMTRPCSDFSGGWRMRIALAKVLVDKPDFLLLDEPTNYLDIEARQWLESWIQRYDGGIMLVAHDRFFLDKTMNSIMEIFNARIQIWQGSYSWYEQMRTEEIIHLTKSFNKQQSEMSRHEDFIKRFRYNAKKASQVQSRIKMLEKIETIELPPHLCPIAIPMLPAPHSGKDVLRLNELHKQYGKHVVLNKLDFSVHRGERIALTGKNGMGKSTLLRIIAGHDTEYGGQKTIGTGVSIGYFDQEAAWSLPENLSILDYLESKARPERQPYIRDLLGAFLFRGDDVQKSTNVLSGGERSRLALLTVLLEPVNLLLLDEPTNHLDIVSQDVLADALQKFDGTSIIVSHDHDFLARVATRVFELGPARHRNFPGDYSYYLERLSQEENAAAENAKTNNVKQQKNESISSGQLDFENQKQRRSEIQRLERLENALLEKIERIQDKISSVEHSLSKPENYSDNEKALALQRELQELNTSLEQLHDEWETNGITLEKMKNERAD